MQDCYCIPRQNDRRGRNAYAGARSDRASELKTLDGD